jgi:uncharacterized Fe-S cluster-containing radical SAM superfamily protein
VTFINTEQFSDSLRQRGIDPVNRRILITRFNGSQQSSDLTIPHNCRGFGRIHHFRRFQDPGWPDNPLPIDPAQHFLGATYSNEIEVQVFQNAICSWRCWYCYVDYSLLSADLRQAEFKSAAELIDLYLEEGLRPPIIDLSGGQPDLVPEWTLWVADELQRRGLAERVYLLSDDNLSNDYLWRYLTGAEIKRLASYGNYGRVGCFKGFDSGSFSFNTGADPNLFDEQFRLMKRLVDTGFDVYGYATFTSTDGNNIDERMEKFVDKLQSEVHERFPLRLIPLKIRQFTPMKGRLSQEHEVSLTIQNLATAAWQRELNKRFPSSVLAQRIHEIRLT